MKLTELLHKHFPQAILEEHAFRGDETVVIKAVFLKKILEFLKTHEKSKCNLLVDITAVDWLERKPRFDVVYHLYSIPLKHRIRVKIRVNDTEPVESVSDLWKGANWLEREVYDMFGIRFRNHPDLRRILMYDEFEGHPLRKDYPLQKEQPRVPYRKEPYNPWKDPDFWKEPTS